MWEGLGDWGGHRLGALFFSQGSGVVSGCMGSWAGIQMPRSLRSLCRDLLALDARGNYLCCRVKALPGRERLAPFKENKKRLQVEQRRHPGETAEMGRGGWVSVSMSPGPPVVMTTGSAGPSLPGFPLA